MLVFIGMILITMGITLVICDVTGAPEHVLFSLSMFIVLSLAVILLFFLLSQFLIRESLRQML